MSSPQRRDEDTTEPSSISGFLKAIGDLAEPLERQAIIERVGRAVAGASDSELGFVGVLDGPDHLKLTGVHGGRTGALDSLTVERGQGLGGKVLALGAASSVAEYVSADTITHEYDVPIQTEGLCGVLCVPLVLRDEVVGVAYVSDRSPRHYSDVMIDRVMTAVESAQVALALADRSQKLTEEAVRVERERTAQTLDSAVGEHLGAIVQIARAIADDPSSSPALLDHATLIIESSCRASSALRGSLGSLSEAPPAASHRAVPNLSPRELEVVQLASRGLSNPEIASELFLARGTVKAYMETALAKLDARNRVEAVMIAARAGLLDDI